MLPRLRSARAFGLGSFFVLLSCACLARAADTDADGRALFDIGVESYQKEQYAAAIVAFREAYRITKRPGLLFSLAQAFRRSYDKTQDPTELREALRYYTQYLTTNAGGERRAEAADWLKRLSASSQVEDGKTPPAVDSARAQLVLAVNVSDAKLTLDGKRIPSLPYAADIAPGKHHLEVSAEGHARYERDIEIAPGSVVPINIVLVRSMSRIEVSGVSGAEVLIDGVQVGKLPAEGFSLASGRHGIEVRQRGYYTLRQTIDSAAGVPQRLELTAPPTTRHTASWVLVGAGAAAALAGGVLSYLALRKQADAQALQDEPGMAPEFERALRARNDLRLAGAVTAGVGVAAGVTGLLSIITEGYGPTRSPPQTKAVLSSIEVTVAGTF